jgi:membrane protein
LNAELERQRVAAAGFPADREPYLRLREDRKLRGKAADSNGSG